jgi:heavy metal efflux system protein
VLFIIHFFVASLQLANNIMLDRIIHFSIRHKLIIGVLSILWVIWGVWSLSRLPVDAVPDITNNQVQIITNSPTLATQEVEQFVTYPIEQSLANLPDIEEIRSISRFGLSVVTVVFDDNVNIYFARQLVNERLIEAASQIPEDMGTPELAPVSTGLGEIYQYIIRPKKGSEHKYSSMDLRTMQDWIVARQLYGIPGVAEVNSFGGMSKQYEVAVDPNRLKAMNVSIPEIFAALEENNENTGGAYIDKKPNAYFIRAIGLATSLDDISKIVIKRSSIGIPVLIRDVADVRFGHAVRYGAVTKDGEQEVVSGIVMMLKGSNSAEVVERVKAKMESIQKSLPADVEIDAFLDRTSLVNRAVNTVKTNLLEGALIVIFVLVLFLGNFRAGLIVASAIPLSLLFALGMMNIFGVSANLMSLGAIDFGLIVDGAVIIVEATMHHLGLRKLDRKFTQEEMDEEVYESASKIRKSAAFGEIIILIVYIPILSLIGIEGKMFRPMAQTVGFAILGALILSLTYIPMMCALFLPKAISQKKNFSDKLMDIFHSIYDPAIRWAIRWKYIVVGSSVALMLATVVVFSGMGGEFIPQLQEGDYAFHCILPQGASLSQSIETSMHASRIIKSFPEVKEVVGKTGSAEVPTDPMPPEASDLIIVLKDKDEWSTTYDYNELAEMMLKKLEVIPGIFFESSQPIQMRFNELMTGVRQDVAVKIFGENIDTLAGIAPKIAQVIQSVEGVTEPQIERTAGLPQIAIEYDRSRMANYGLTVKGVNKIISTAFAGQSAGVIYENERKFDLVVRLDTAHRTSIEDVANLFIPTNDGNQIPLSQVATVSFKEGPAQISREDAKRRVVVGFNVRGRDVKSVVEEIQAKLNSLVTLPTGYYLTYGGSFENLSAASDRLSIAVPISLFLIFVLLYFTFHSGKQAALVFTAIPMSAIGGVFALLIRDMPFSISAGVGFIALFGVAVLNGIVLIGTFNQLKKEEVDPEDERIVEARVLAGTNIRLRPVLMTATVASLGFLPMAISTGAGAEVQKPLATVVIGGLITATILTLIVLPLLYIIFSMKKPRTKRRLSLRALPLVLLILPMLAFGQTTSPQRISLNEAIDSAMHNNLQLIGDSIQVLKSRALVGAASEIPKTGVFIENEDYNPEDPNGVYKIGLSQEFEWPGVYAARSNVAKQQLQLKETNERRTIAEVRRDVRRSYYTLGYLENKMQLWERLDSIYQTLAGIANLRVRTGESAGLDSLSANAKAKEISIQVGKVGREIVIEQQILRKLLNTQAQLLPENAILTKFTVTTVSTLDLNHPILQVQKQAISVSEAQIDVEQQSLLPDFQFRLFAQQLYGVSKPYSGFSLTVGVPLFFGSYTDKIESAKLETQYQLSTLNLQQQELQSAYVQIYEQLQKDSALIDYYQTNGLRQADEIIRSSNLAYKAGEISFAELSQFLTQAIEIEHNYLDALNSYNQSAIHLSFLLNN